jgi:hypothetical protein
MHLADSNWVHARGAAAATFLHEANPGFGCSIATSPVSPTDPGSARETNDQDSGGKKQHAKGLRTPGPDEYLGFAGLDRAQKARTRTRADPNFVQLLSQGGSVMKCPTLGGSCYRGVVVSGSWGRWALFRRKPSGSVRDLALGTPENTVIRKLTESGYSLERILAVPEFQQKKGITSMWVAKQKQGETHIFNDLGFANGKLELVARELSTRDEVEFGRQLYFAMHDLETEGNSRCTIETESGETPDFSMKTAKLQCGKKSLEINLQHFGKQPESVQLSEVLSGHP